MSALTCALAKITALGEPVQHRMERAGPDGIAMPAKLLDEPRP
jgi:hypothetical protein